MTASEGFEAVASLFTDLCDVSDIKPHQLSRRTLLQINKFDWNDAPGIGRWALIQRIITAVVTHTPNRFFRDIALPRMLAESTVAPVATKYVRLQLPSA